MKVTSVTSSASAASSLCVAASQSANPWAAARGVEREVCAERTRTSLALPLVGEAVAADLVGRVVGRCDYGFELGEVLLASGPAPR